ncbi:MAG: Ku protein [Myxococcales bacterium]|nr:Ku protein [Myxococcales bacterium]
MPRAIWEGTISFGLVQIPVGLYTAEKRNDLEFHQLDRRDLAPVGNRRYNRKTDKEVEWGDVVKGYEYAEGKYVVLEKEDLQRANPRATQTVELVEFVDQDAIEPIYYEKPYYLAPGKRGAKAYVLLREVLKKSNKVGVARVVIRTREHVAALMVRGPALVLMLLRYDHEIVPPSKLELPGGGVKTANIAAGELKMAERLVEDMSDKFDPAEFKDSYHDDLLGFIKKKIRAGDTAEVEVPEELEAPEPSNVVDIMALLRRSLEKDGKAEPRAARKTAAKKTTKKTTAKKTTAKKTTAKKTTAKKTARKTTAKKTAAKKTTKKAASRKSHATRKAA